MLFRVALFILGLFTVHRLILYFIGFLKDRLMRELSGNRRRIQPKGRIKETLQQRYSRSVRYLYQTKQGGKLIVLPFVLFGAALTAIFAIFELYLPAVGMIIIYPFVGYIIFITRAKNDLAELDKLFERMMVLKRSCMGLATAKEDEPTFDTEFEVLEWDKNGLFPKRLRIMLPVTFDSLRSEEFLTRFNLAFGGDHAWAPDIEDKDFPGWQFKKGVLTLKSDDPLPDKAMWSADWLNPEYCAWSFFPLAIGTQGGTMMPDPETGEEVHIIGTDFFGEQQKLAKRNEFWCSQEILASPQVLIAGATGGGKSLAVDTLIYEENTNREKV